LDKVLLAPVTRFSGKRLSDICNITDIGKRAFIPICPNSDLDIINRTSLTTYPSSNNPHSYQSLFLLPTSLSALEFDDHTTRFLDRADYDRLLNEMKGFKKILDTGEAKLHRIPWSVESSPGIEASPRPQSHRGESSSGAQAAGYHQRLSPQIPSASTSARRRESAMIPTPAFDVAGIKTLEI
jgi:hypothetical protein